MSSDNETAARRAGEQELQKRLDAGESADSAVYRGWLAYHNRHGGADSWPSWKAQYLNGKANNMGKSKLQKALDRAAPLSPSVPRPPAIRPVSIAGAGSTAALAPFEHEVAKAEADLTKARKAQDAYAIAAAQRDLQEAQYRLTAMKFVVAENARERDPSLTARALRGQGVPLVTNRHALRDDPSLREI